MTIQQISKSFAELKINELEQDPRDLLLPDSDTKDTYSSDGMIWYRDVSPWPGSLHQSSTDSNLYSSVSEEELFNALMHLSTFFNPLWTILTWWLEKQIKSPLANSANSFSLCQTYHMLKFFNKTWCKQKLGYLFRIWFCRPVFLATTWHPIDRDVG